MPDGRCRIGPPLTHTLALDRPYWRRLALQAVADLCGLIDHAAKGKANRGRPAESLGIGTRPRMRSLRENRPHIQSAPLPSAPQILSVPVPCARCSAPIHTRRKRYCDKCLRDVQLEVGRRNSERARRALAAMSVDPRFTHAAQRQRAEHISAAHRDNRGWNKSSVD
jgi:hypothetical protein